MHGPQEPRGSRRWARLDRQFFGAVSSPLDVFSFANLDRRLAAAEVSDAADRDSARPRLPGPRTRSARARRPAILRRGRTAGSATDSHRVAAGAIRTLVAGRSRDAARDARFHRADAARTDKTL